MLRTSTQTAVPRATRSALGHQAARRQVAHLDAMFTRLSGQTQPRHHEQAIARNVPLVGVVWGLIHDSPCSFYAFPGWGAGRLPV
jgi:hypothetical protein